MVEKPELRIKDFELYNAYYCGVCKSIGRRYGQAERFVLSYDAAFLALLLAGLSDDEDSFDRQHCMVHPVRRKTVVSNEDIDYAADVMLILAWHKIRDDVHDEGKLYSKALLKLTEGRYRKLKGIYPELCGKVEDGLDELTELEKRRCESLDEVSDSFACIMEAVIASAGKCGQERALSEIGYHLGKWIYIIDAFDDLEDNIKNGVYNPLVYRYSFRGDDENAAEFADRIREDVRRDLLMHLSQMGLCADLLDLKKNREVIDNVIYMGLLRKTESVLDGKNEKKKWRQK